MNKGDLVLEVYLGISLHKLGWLMLGGVYYNGQCVG